MTGLCKKESTEQTRSPPKWWLRNKSQFPETEFVPDGLLPALPHLCLLRNVPATFLSPEICRYVFNQRTSRGLWALRQCDCDFIFFTRLSQAFKFNFFLLSCAIISVNIPFCTFERAFHVASHHQKVQRVHFLSRSYKYGFVLVRAAYKQTLCTFALQPLCVAFEWAARWAMRP